MAGMEPESIDAIVTDPPYHLTTGKKGGTGPASLNPNSPAGRSRIGTGFMGKAWDGGDISFRPETWAAALRVLKPGGHMVVMCGTRTEHRVACAVEDAGFEIRDRLLWLYGSGFPKSHNLHDKWEGWGTALKPAMELGVLARKPLIGTVADNVARYGTGALNIDGCRVEYANAADQAAAIPQGRATSKIGALAGGTQNDRERSEFVPRNDLGRWPANVIHDGSEEVLEAFPNAPEQIADASSSDSRKTQNVYGAMKRGNGRDGEASADSDNEGAVGFKMKLGARRGDAGSAARFFYCAKASTRERNGSKHPTVKPLALMRWLVRLVTPPGGVVLDPFAGTGTTGQAAIEEGFQSILIEREHEYIADIRRRLNLLPSVEEMLA